MNKIIYKIIRLKKFFLPTKFDKQLKQEEIEQTNFYKQFINKGDLCFDIGANVGYKSKIFYKLGAKVVAVEPQKNCVREIKLKLGNKVTVLENGVGAENTIKEFYVANNSQLSSFDKNWVSDLENTRFSEIEVEKVERIEILTLDNLIGKYGTPNFIKIDVEGYELEVLKGLNLKFEMLSFEYAVPEKLDSVISCLVHLSENFKNLKCNYCEGNVQSKFNLKDWISLDDMIAYVKKDYFQNTFAGDIYVKANI